MSTYADFLAAKSQRADGHGFEPTVMPDHLFDFQSELVQWAVRQGRAAIFADCGMGKTPMELAWAQNVHEHTGKPVLLLTPLAVGFQIVQEAAKFGHEAAQSRNGKAAAAITVFVADDFGMTPAAPAASAWSRPSIRHAFCCGCVARPDRRRREARALVQVRPPCAPASGCRRATN